VADAPETTESGASPLLVDLLKDVVQSAHDAVDTVADNAVPPILKMAEGVAAAEDALQAKAARLRDTGDAWAESLRNVVRDHPLAALASALALGLLIARIAR